MEDLQKMQQEAVKRVQEMQKRAKISLEYSNSGINRQKENTKETLPPNETKNYFNLILLLYDEKSDLGLILALLYIML